MYHFYYHLVMKCNVLLKLGGLFVICEQLNVSIKNAPNIQVHLAETLVTQLLN